MRMNLRSAITLIGLIMGTNLSAQTAVTPAKPAVTPVKSTTVPAKSSPQTNTANTSENRAHIKANKMKSTLGLNDEQTQSVYGILLKYDQKLTDAFKTNTSPEGRKQAFQGISKDRETELKGVLTPEQYTKYQANKQQMGINTGSSF